MSVIEDAKRQTDVVRLFHPLIPLQFKEFGVRCRQCGNTLPTGVVNNGADPGEASTDETATVQGGVDANSDEPSLCFFCVPENEASRADRQVWMDAADRVVESVSEPPTPKRWSGTITIVDDDWERLDDRRIETVLPRKKATDYYAILDEPDAFDERAWLTFMGAEYAIEHIDGTGDSSAA